MPISLPAAAEADRAEPEIAIRWLIRRDMESVLRIEADSFEEPWSDDDFLCCLRQRTCIGMVCENARFEIVGFMIYELQKGRLQILNLAVAPRHRRHGIGRLMIARLRDKLSQFNRSELLAEVRESNLPAQLFLRSQGFRAIRVLRDHYDRPKGGTEAAYVMQLRVGRGERLEARG